MLDLLGGRQSRSASSLPPTDDDWYLNLLWIDRQKCLLLTHAGTLSPSSGQAFVARISARSATTSSRPSRPSFARRACLPTRSPSFSLTVFGLAKTASWKVHVWAAVVSAPVSRGLRGAKTAIRLCGGSARRARVSWGSLGEHGAEFEAGVAEGAADAAVEGGEIGAVGLGGGDREAVGEADVERPVAGSVAGDCRCGRDKLDS